MSRDKRGPERTRRIHRGAANRTGEHRFESNDGADDDSGGDPFLSRTGRDPENHEHQQGGKQELQNEGLQRSAGWLSRAQEAVIREQEPHDPAGREGAGGLADDVRQHFASGQLAREPKANRDGRINVRA